jgi:hypothetical protein
VPATENTAYAVSCASLLSNVRFTVLVDAAGRQLRGILTVTSDTPRR